MDFGIGLSEDINFENPSTLGLQLVVNLARQLKATLDVNRNNGTAFKLSFDTAELSREAG